MLHASPTRSEKGFLCHVKFLCGLGLVDPCFIVILYIDCDCFYLVGYFHVLLKEVVGARQHFPVAALR